MIASSLFSIRMRSTAGGRHVSGAERIVREKDIELTVQGLIERARDRGHPADSIVISIDSVPAEQVMTVRALDMIVSDAADRESCRALARIQLARAGVLPSAIDAAMAALDLGPSVSGGNMRGAMIMDAETGERLEPDQERGIRASRFDWNGEAAAQIGTTLAKAGLTHFRTQEALALASKVARAPGMVAELCWSDDPDYTAGYVASPSFGYLRLPFMKDLGSMTGGRAFFISRAVWNPEAFRAYLQETPVLITGPVAVLRPSPEAISQERIASCSNKNF
jgi:6-carboxyhexanoate--CoA ligase